MRRDQILTAAALAVFLGLLPIGPRHATFPQRAGPGAFTTPPPGHALPAANLSGPDLFGASTIPEQPARADSSRTRPEEAAASPLGRARDGR